VNGHLYIGQSVNLAQRKRQHFSNIHLNNHCNSHLQNAVNLYGIDKFSFKTLFLCESSELTYYEQKFVDILNPIYNIRRECVDSQKGVLVGRHLPEEHRKNISKAQTGKKHPCTNSEEARKNRANAQLGRHQTDEAKRKLSEYFTGRPWPESRKNYITSEATKLKISQKLKGRPWSDKRRNHVVSEETKRKISKALSETLAKKRALTYKETI
jgi:group I intron endonuclease